MRWPISEPTLRNDPAASPGVGSAFKDVGNALLLAVLGLLGLTLVALAVAWIAARTPIVRGLPGARDLRRPVIDVESLDDSALGDTKLGASTTGLLRARVRGEGQAGGRVDLAAGEAGSSEALAGLSAVGSQAQALTALIGWIGSTIRTSQWGVGGELHAESSEGRGLTLHLTHEGNYNDFAAFWALADGGPATTSQSETYRRLTIPAAGWVRHRVAEARDAELSTTADPRSYALFEAGLFWQEQGEPIAARSFYDRALAFDPRNVFAEALSEVGAAADVEDGSRGRIPEAVNPA